MTNGIGLGFFITGTDTGIGKTFVAKLLCEAFGSWRTVRYMKPVQTGCIRGPGGLAAPDFDAVTKDMVLPPHLTIDDFVPYRFEPACSPHLAATRAGVLISLEDIREKYTRIADKKSVTIVEGAGGILTPLSEDTTMIDCMLTLRIPVVLVTTPRVGTLNHTFLSIDGLERRGIVPAGIVVNNVHQMPEDFIYHDNLRMMRDRMPQTPFLEVPFEGTADERVIEFTHEIIVTKATP